MAVIYAHLSEPPPRPSRVRADLPDGLDDVIAKALDKNPGPALSVLRGADGRGEGGRRRPPGRSAETLPPRRAAPPSRGADARRGRAARRSRVLLAGVDASTRAIAHVALGGRVDMREAASAGALDAARDARPDLVILGWPAESRRRAARGPADARLQGAAGGRRGAPAATRARRAPTSACRRRSRRCSCRSSCASCWARTPSARDRRRAGGWAGVATWAAPSRRAVLGGEPLIARAAARRRAPPGSRPWWWPSADTVLPPLDVPVWIEPDEPFHPLAGSSPRSSAAPWWRSRATSRGSRRSCCARWPTARAGVGWTAALRAVPGLLRPVAAARAARGARRRGVAARDARPARPGELELVAFGDPRAAGRERRTRPTQLAAAARGLREL